MGDYGLFIKSKKTTIQHKGIDVDFETLNKYLHDWQKEVVPWALKKGKCLLAEKCGLGKTIQQLAWSQQVCAHTGGSVLILAPLGVAKQTAKEEAIKFGFKVNYCRNQSEVITGINITNYEMLDHFDASSFAGVVLDESSILKNFTGNTRVKLNNAFKNTQYKLCCSATPAPNEFMELLNQADFLGIMDTAKALSNYFINDFKTGKWRLKGHATAEFWKWVCSWCLMIDSPKDLGFDDTAYILPEMKINHHIVQVSELSDNFENGFFREIGTSATSFHKEKSRTAEARAKKTVELIEDDKQYIIWCDTNEEADLLKKYLPDATEIRGSHSINIKEEAIDKFKSGEIKILISKSIIFGYGMNFQNCSSMIFCGLNYSYEKYYQAINRIHRFGQKNIVDIHIVLSSTENHILEVLNEKQARQDEIKNQLKVSVKDMQLLSFQRKEQEENYYISKVELPQWLQ